jgi:hypothetical protein
MLFSYPFPDFGYSPSLPQQDLLVFAPQDEDRDDFVLAR